MAPSYLFLIEMISMDAYLKVASRITLLRFQNNTGFLQQPVTERRYNFEVEVL